MQWAVRQMREGLVKKSRELGTLWPSEDLSDTVENVPPSSHPRTREPLARTWWDP